MYLAESGGALSVLNEFHNDAILCKDKSIHWIFVVSKPVLAETDNIKVLRYPWIKKSWFHRLFFDNFVAAKLVRKYDADKILSLQNITIPYTKIKQDLYVHNSLPFIDYRFPFKKNKHLWVYQNIIGRSIIKSIKNADEVIVQTEWMKKAIIEIGIVNKNIEVVPPKINLDVKSFFEANKHTLSTFFYPASAFDYKNHKLIVEACKILKKNQKKLNIRFYLL
ncbi:glycosyltransferase [Peribacillus sp. TH16]|uniref:glycosyltransferase n=1 Tax=Peribacillus sp. TH16 TaxID=2798482 RepID=UPI0019119286|nr:glycosyltransferase [Peribacillus sp. TH16]MBK5484110.1 glycosyltransferase [Peribacillus sp. TH16]